MRDLTPIEFRRVGSSVDIQENPVEAIAYQHTVFCQTCLPYKDCHNLRTWERRQGCVYLRVEAGAIRHPGVNHYSDVGLPYGSRPRLILAHLNRESLVKNSPKIEVEASLTAFIKRVTRHLSPNTREIGRFKDQLTRFAACNVRMSVDLPDNRAYQVNAQIIDAMELWLAKDERQRVLWPAYVELSPRYFESLQKYAVPLDERAIAALANSPMALDVYAWLAQRLCRVNGRRGQFVAWSCLKDQFGFGFSRMDNFKAAFRQILHEVHGQYRQANFDLDDRGLLLHESLPPVAPRCRFVLAR